MRREVLGVRRHITGLNEGVCGHLSILEGSSLVIRRNSVHPGRNMIELLWSSWEFGGRLRYGLAKRPPEEPNDSNTILSLRRLMLVKDIWFIHSLAGIGLKRLVQGSAIRQIKE